MIYEEKNEQDCWILVWSNLRKIHPIYIQFVLDDFALFSVKNEPFATVIVATLDISFSLIITLKYHVTYNNIEYFRLKNDSESIRIFQKEFDDNLATYGLKRESDWMNIMFRLNRFLIKKMEV